MPWNGAGVFSRIYNWVNDRDAAIKITASRMDGEDDSFEAGINACLTKNGENTPTANLPMDGNRHTGVGNAAARDDYAAAGQVQDSAFTYDADTGSANTYAITPSPAITAYAEGQTFTFKAANANTGASTLNVSGLGAKELDYDDGTDIASGEIAAGGIYTATYDGTKFRIVGVQKDILGNAATATAATTATSATTATTATNLSGGSITGVTDAGDFERSVGAPGYTKLPGGLTMQWGQVAIGDIPGAGTNGSVVFPIAFTTGYIVVTDILDTSGANPASFTTAFSPTGFNWKAIEITSGTQNATLQWFAVGVI